MRRFRRLFWRQSSIVSPEQSVCISRLIFHSILPFRNAAKPVLGRVTNNVGEIQAAIYAIKTALDLGIKKLSINTDSQFLINSITKWVPGWKKRGWRLPNMEPVKNVVDFKELDELLQSKEINVNWVRPINHIYYLTCLN